MATCRVEYGRMQNGHLHARDLKTESKIQGLERNAESMHVRVRNQKGGRRLRGPHWKTEEYVQEA